MAIKEWVRHYSYERYQRRFGVRTHYEVRSEALCNENPIQYPIPENKAIQKYKQHIMHRYMFLIISPIYLAGAVHIHHLLNM